MMFWAAIVFSLLLSVAIFFNLRPVAGGIDEGRLAPCPNKPNCVCSQDTDPQHAIEPLPAVGADPMITLAQVVRQMPRTAIVKETPNYLHATFQSKVFRFIDDVEFLYDPEEKVIQVRSASRLGYSDFGVNRDRIEEIRNALTL